MSYKLCKPEATKMPKSFSSNFLSINPLTALTSPRHSDVFSKTKASHRPNTKGQPSVVLYRKTDKLPHYKFELNFKDSGYVTDGGIHKKRERYTNTNVHSPKHTFISSTSKGKPLVSSKSMRIKKQPNANLILITTCPNKNMSSHHNMLSPSKMRTNIASPKNRTSSAVTSPSNKKYTLSPSHQSSVKTKKKHHKDNNNTNINLPQQDQTSKASVQQQYNEEDKLNQQQLLLERDIKNLLRDSQLSKDDIDRRREFERKRQKLSDNGVCLKHIDKLLNGESPSQSESNEATGSVSAKNVYHPKIKQIHLKHKPQAYSTTNTNYNNATNNPSKLSSPSRQVLKPKIDNLEFCQQIQQRRKFKPKSKKGKPNNTKISINSSFRESSAKHNKPHTSSSASLLDSKASKATDYERLASQKKSHHHSQENIQKYMYVKRKNELLSEENKIKQTNKRILSNFQELFNLSNVRCFPKTTKHKLTKPKQHKYMSSSLNISTIIDENKFKNEVCGIKHILFQSDDAMLLLPLPSANHHSDSNTTIGSEHPHPDERTNEDAKRPVKKPESIMNSHHSKSMSHKHSEDNNEQIQEEDLLTSERNKPTVTSKYERTPNSPVPNKAVPSAHSTNANNNANTNLHHIDDNTRTTSDVVVTKDVNMPSLSHSYDTNTNPNHQHIDIGIEPRCVLNLVEILKLSIQRRVLYFLYEIYFSEMLIRQYIFAFDYFVALVKNYAFRQLENYVNYKSYYYNFIKAISPFLRRQFEFFMNQCQYRKRIEYLTEFLTKRIKLTCLEEIYFYGYERAAQQKRIIDIYKVLTRPYLTAAFETFARNVKRLETSGSSNRRNTFAFAYQSSSESYYIEPNSEGSPKLHNLYRMMESLPDRDIDLSVLKENAKEKIWKQSYAPQQRERDIMHSHSHSHDTSIKKSEDNNENGHGNGHGHGNVLAESIEGDEEHQTEQPQSKDKNNAETNEAYGDSDREITQELKQHAITEQDISVDKEQCNIDWVLHLPSSGNRSKENETRITNEKPKLEIIVEPPKETLLQDFPQPRPNKQSKTVIPNDNNNSNNTKIDLPFTPAVPKEPSTKQVVPSSDNITPTANKAPDVQHETSTDPFAQLDIDSLADAITNDIINSMVQQEIHKPKLLPHKHFLPQANPNNNLQLSQSGSLTSSSLNLNNSDKRDSSPKNASFTNTAFFSGANENVLAAYSFASVFNRTAKEKKRQHAIGLYNEQIGPQLIQLIKSEIIANYSEIFRNISSPLRNIPEGLMTSLVLENRELLTENYRLSQIHKEISEILNKQTLLDKFFPTNKAIRMRTSKWSGRPLEYDDMLNNCLIDAAIELINKERKYGDAGEPLPWSSRTRDIAFKYAADNPSKLASYIERQLTLLLNEKMGLISDNYEYLYAEQVNIERDRKIMESIKRELKEEEQQWSNFEIQETQLKLEVTDMILEQCYNEVVEILEHIEFSRKRPDLYQYKSIYACEEMPRLSFQMTTTNEGQDDSDVINM